MERKISATGTSGYALKDASGRCALWVASLLTRGGIVEVERKISATGTSGRALKDAAWQVGGGELLGQCGSAKNQGLPMCRLPRCASAHRKLSSTLEQGARAEARRAGHDAADAGHQRRQPGAGLRPVCCPSIHAQDAFFLSFFPVCCIGMLAMMSRLVTPGFSCAQHNNHAPMHNVDILT